MALALAIPELLGRTVDTLSGGELQRVALAAALVTRPALVLLDEPTSQLDPVAGDELIWLLRRLNEEWGVTIVLAEHRLERCLAAADRVVAMDAGRIAFDGDPRGFLSWAQGADPALETPAPASSRSRESRRSRPASATPDGSLAEIDGRGRGVGPLRRLVLFRRGRRETRRPPAKKYERRRGVRPPGSTALELRDLWVELGDGEAEARRAARAWTCGASAASAWR